MVCNAPAYFDGVSQGERILDDGWSGACVVTEKTLQSGRQVVQVAVDPHRQGMY